MLYFWNAYEKMHALFTTQKNIFDGEHVYLLNKIVNESCYVYNGTHHDVSHKSFFTIHSKH